MVIIRKVDLRMNEQKKYEVIKKLADTNGNRYYALADEQGCRADFYKGTPVIVIRTLSGKLYVYAMAGKEEQWAC